MSIEKNDTVESITIDTTYNQDDPNRPLDNKASLDVRGSDTDTLLGNKRRRHSEAILDIRNSDTNTLTELKRKRRSEQQELALLCKELEEKHRLGASIETLHLIGIAFGFFEIAATSYGYGDFFSNAIKIPEAATQFLRSFNQTQQKRVDNQINILREIMRDTSATTDQKIDAIRKLDQLIHDIRERRDRELQTIMR